MTNEERYRMALNRSAGMLSSLAADLRDIAPERAESLREWVRYIDDVLGGKSETMAVEP